MAVTLASLWLPILLSAVAVFFMSSLMWMVLPHHRNDWVKLPDEEGFLGVMKGMGARAGQYAFPWGDKESMKDPEFVRRCKEGPSGLVIVRPGYNLGKNLVTSFLYNLVLTIFVAYLATFTLTTQTEPVDVFRLTSISMFLACAGALGWGAIWFGRTWSSTILEMVDGFAYACATGLIFALMW